MTKQQSILLDILLTDFLKPEYRGNGGYVNIEKVINGNEKLKNLSESELNKLLYIIRVEQIKIGIQLLSGSAVFTVFNSHIKDFLNIGGFKKLHLKKRNEFYFKWTVFIITILTFIILIYSTFFQETWQTEKSEKTNRLIKQTEQLIETKKEKRWTDSNGNVFIEKGNEVSIIPAKYNKTGKIYKVFIYNETLEEIGIIENLKIKPNEFKVFNLKDTDTLKLDNGVKFMFGETYGLEIEDKKSQVSGLGGKFLDEYKVPNDAEWAFVIVPKGKGD
jgi:hypothetical protein